MSAGSANSLATASLSPAFSAALQARTAASMAARLVGGPVSGSAVSPEVVVGSVPLVAGGGSGAIAVVVAGAGAGGVTGVASPSEPLHPAAPASATAIATSWRLLR
jgi:hypothetical protein